MLRVSETFVRNLRGLHKRDPSLSPSKVRGHRERSFTPEQVAWTRGLAAKQPGLAVALAFVEFRSKWPGVSSPSTVHRHLTDAGYEFKRRERGAAGKSPRGAEDALSRRRLRFRPATPT